MWISRSRKAILLALLAFSLAAQSPLVWIDTPTPGVQPSSVMVQGWAVDNSTPPSLIQGVVVQVDRQFAGQAVYGDSRPDVCAVFSRPGCPAVGFHYPLTLSPGVHNITAMAISTALKQGVSSSVAVMVPGVIQGPPGPVGPQGPPGPPGTSPVMAVFNPTKSAFVSPDSAGNYTLDLPGTVANVLLVQSSGPPIENGWEVQNNVLVNRGGLSGRIFVLWSGK